jgi:hypothetical protein
MLTAEAETSNFRSAEFRRRSQSFASQPLAWPGQLASIFGAWRTSLRLEQRTQVQVPSGTEVADAERDFPDEKDLSLQFAANTLANLQVVFS